MANLLFVCDTFAPNVGGSEQILRDLARAAVSRGHAAVVYTPRSDSPLDMEAEFDRQEPYRIIRSQAWRTLFRHGGSRNPLVSRAARALIVFLLFWRMLRLRDVELIVVGHALPAGNVAVAIKRMRGIPIVVVTYGEEITMYARGSRMRRMLASVLSGANVVTTLTEDTAEEIRSLAPPVADRVVVCPPAVEGPSRPPAPDEITVLRQQLGIENRKILVTVGRLVPRKGFDVTMQAVAQLAPEYPDLVYLIVGTGPYEIGLRRLSSELDIESRVIFGGSGGLITAPWQYYYACDVFVMPNRIMENGEREGYGIVFVEAGLAGKPVIGGRTGGAPDAIDDGVTGFLVDPTDPGDVAAAIRKLLDDPALADRMGDAGRARALEINSAQIASQRFEQIVQSALDPQNRAEASC